MKKNKKRKIGIIVFLILSVIIVIGCIITQIILKEKSKELKKESEKYEITNTVTKSGKEIETEYIRVENNKFFIKKPLEFKRLDNKTINEKYNGDIPNIVFSSEDTKINLAIKMTENEMKNNQIKSYKEQMENILKESSKIIETKDYKIDGYNIGQIKLITQAEDIDIYNNMIFFSYNNKLVIITFNCTIDLKEEWQEVGDFLIDSLFFTE